MESVLPFSMICLLPLLWTVFVFMLGRWSVRYRLRIEPSGLPQASPYQQSTSGFYEKFEEV